MFRDAKLADLQPRQAIGNHLPREVAKLAIVRKVSRYSGRIVVADMVEAAGVEPRLEQGPGFAPCLLRVMATWNLASPDESMPSPARLQ